MSATRSISPPTCLHHDLRKSGDEPGGDGKGRKGLSVDEHALRSTSFGVCVEGLYSFGTLCRRIPGYHRPDEEDIVQSMHQVHTTSPGGGRGNVPTAKVIKTH